MKINGVKGNLTEQVTVTLEGGKILFVSNVRIAKRYIKYLTKKYLKKQGIIDYLKIISFNKGTYKINYVKNQVDDQEDNVDEEN